MPLFRAINKVLYTLCKIRGPNIISRFFSGEPRYLEPMLYVLEISLKEQAAHSIYIRHALTWEERYILLLWLGHLTLAPFDLTTIDSSAAAPHDVDAEGIPLPLELPILAARLVKAALVTWGAAGKDREAAVLLLVRVVMRPDMRLLGLHGSALQWSLASLCADYQSDKSDSVYRTVSSLRFVAGFVKAADPEVVRPFLLSTFDTMQRIDKSSTRRALELRASALARKDFIKVYRGLSVAVIQSDLNSGQQETNIAEHLLDSVMGHLLESLADRDTLVRFAASKAISVVTSKLSPAMTADVSEAILEGLRDDVLPGGRSRVAIHVGANRDARCAKTVPEQNLIAVSSLRWHGLVLALSQLLYRRAPPVDQLADIIDALLLALTFEQRSSTGASVGAAVRDAACFGIWAIARKYTTQELCGVQLSLIDEDTKDFSTIQTLANHLVAAAVCDTSGNIRRGASAALQELIGRHPDTIAEGIQLVQTVDYHGVALRSRALRQVAIKTATLSPRYWEAIAKELLAWRGVDAASVEARRLAADSLGLLAMAQGASGIELLADALQKSHGCVDTQNVERRHGIFLAAAAVAHAWRGLETKADEDRVSSKVMQTWRLVEDVSPNDIITKIRKADLTIEATCTLICALASLRAQGQETKPQSYNEHCILLLQHCLAHRGPVDRSCVREAAKGLFLVLNEVDQGTVLEQWLSRAAGGQDSNPESHGYLRALGAIYGTSPCSKKNSQRIKDIVLTVIRREPTVETKIAALHGLGNIMRLGKMQPLLCLWVGTDDIEEAIDQSVLDVLISCLGDYTTDQRGDIGSQVRIAAIEVVQTALRSSSVSSAEIVAALASKIYVLAGEKLDRCRLQAQVCLSELFQYDIAVVASSTAGIGAKIKVSDLTHNEQHRASQQTLDVISISSPEYFVGILSAAASQGLLRHLLQGLVTSIGAGSESIMVASRCALSRYLEQSDVEQQVSLLRELQSLLRAHYSCERLSVPILETLSYVLELVPAREIDDTRVL